MDADRFDGLSRSLTAGRSRRQVLRGLAGAALVGALGVRSAVDVDAGRKRKRKRKKKGHDACRSGKRVDRLNVPANGDSVTTRVLERGQRYRVRVSGYIQDEDWGLDAEYYFLSADPTNEANVYDACFDGTDVGLSIDDAHLDDDKAPRWGAYDADHVYERRVKGRGKRLRLRLHDCYYPGNSGTLKVEIFCA